MAQTKASGRPTASPSVFISYAWADEQSALAIDQWLRNRGARVLIDRRDFLPGSDIEAEIVRCVKQAGKVACIYSKNSANRPYPELERRIASALEKQQIRKTPRRRLIYFCIDDTPLPTEALPRLAIMAAELEFDHACEELWRAILGRAAEPQKIDLSEYKEYAPWKTEREESRFDARIEELLDNFKIHFAKAGLEDGAGNLLRFLTLPELSLLAWTSEVNGNELYHRAKEKEEDVPENAFVLPCFYWLVEGYCLSRYLVADSLAKEEPPESSELIQRWHDVITSDDWVHTWSNDFAMSLVERLGERAKSKVLTAFSDRKLDDDEQHNVDDLTFFMKLCMLQGSVAYRFVMVGAPNDSRASKSNPKKKRAK